MVGAGARGKLKLHFPSCVVYKDGVQKLFAQIVAVNLLPSPPTLRNVLVAAGWGTRIYVQNANCGILGCLGKKAESIICLGIIP